MLRLFSGGKNLFYSGIGLDLERKSAQCANGKDARNVAVQLAQTSLKKGEPGQEVTGGRQGKSL